MRMRPIKQKKKTTSNYKLHPQIFTTPLPLKKREGEKKMSKYGHLLEQVSCEWLLDLEGIQCTETFKDVKELTEHVKKEHVLPEEDARRSEEGNNNGGRLCGWIGCGQVVVGGESAYIAHVSFHPYHSFLKLLGAELQVRCYN